MSEEIYHLFFQCHFNGSTYHSPTTIFRRFRDEFNIELNSFLPYNHEYEKKVRNIGVCFTVLKHGLQWGLLTRKQMLSWGIFSSISVYVIFELAPNLSLDLEHGIKLEKDFVIDLKKPFSE